jgi:hypothetical protein
VADTVGDRHGLTRSDAEHPEHVVQFGVGQRRDIDVVDQHVGGGAAEHLRRHDSGITRRRT